MPLVALNQPEIDLFSLWMILPFARHDPNFFTVIEQFCWLTYSECVFMPTNCLPLHHFHFHFRICFSFIVCAAFVACGISFSIFHRFNNCVDYYMSKLSASILKTLSVFVCVCAQFTYFNFNKYEVKSFCFFFIFVSVTLRFRRQRKTEKYITKWYRHDQLQTDTNNHLKVQFRYVHSLRPCLNG